MTVQDLLAKPQHLPTLPALLVRLVESFNDENISVEDITREIELDSALSAKLLRMANSAFFHSSRKISTVNEAVRMLGFVMVRNLVIANGVAGACTQAPGLDIPTFWRYNLASACVARWLAGTTRQNSDLAFMVGLLAGIGQFVMRTGMTEPVLALDRAIPLYDDRRAQAELAKFGFDASAVGAALAAQWQFPEAICEGIAQSSFPLQGKTVDALACVVHLARWRARHHVLGSKDAAIAKSYPARVGEALNLGPEWAIAGTRKAADDMERMPAVVELMAGMEDLVA
jgi:HD-like signal output (HDOD) protein